MTYTIKYSNGRTDTADTYDAAIEAVRAEYPDAEIGHDGDLENGGDRTLCWETEDEAADDDGASAIASIYEAR